MSRLDELIQELCPDGVEYRKLEDCCTVLDKKRKPVTKAGTPVVTWAEGKIWVNNHAHIIEETGDVLLRYLFHYIQTIGAVSYTHLTLPTTERV